MNTFRRSIAVMLIAALAWSATPVAAQTDSAAAKSMLHGWYGVVLKLVRHTPTYSPPVASRSFAYLGVTAFEALASGNGGLQSLAGKLNGLQPVPGRASGRAYDDAVVVQAALAHAVRNFFGNTGPTGQRVMAAAEKKFRAQAAAGLEPAVVIRSEAYGRAVAEHILAWSQGDGGATIENMGFPYEYELSQGDAHWVPTSAIAQQQKPLLPQWGGNRTFAMPDGASCPLPSPPPYSEDKSSEFYRQALEVYETAAKLSAEQQVIARFWSDDPMLSPTPPGHWLAIALESLAHENAGAERIAEVMARLGVAMADAFVGCWNSKFQYDLLRPVTYIRRMIDPKWEPLLITPPFPEYPSGHSTQSGAAATVLTEMFGANFAFADKTHERDGMPARNFPNFWAAAEEAGISRLYGGIHFRAAVERGLDQGRCIGAYAMALRTRR